MACPRLGLALSLRSLPLLALPPRPRFLDALTDVVLDAQYAQPPEGGDPLPYVGWGPYDDEREWRAWLHVWVANLVECPSCGADAGQPCRTHTGRIPAGSPLTTSPG
jgi:hypothetical protein